MDLNRTFSISNIPAMLTGSAQTRGIPGFCEGELEAPRDAWEGSEGIPGSGGRTKKSATGSPVERLGKAAPPAPGRAAGADASAVGYIGLIAVSGPPAWGVMKAVQGVSTDSAADMLASDLSHVTCEWKFLIDDMITSPCLGSYGTVYVGSDNGKVYALKDGKKQWEFQTGGEVFSSPCPGPDGTVYVGSTDLNVYALKDGNKIWEYETGGSVNSLPCPGPDGIVYVGSDDGKVYALKDGKKLWEFQTGAGEVNSFTHPCLGPDGIVYVGSEDGKVYALKDGKKLWEFQTGGEVLSSPCPGPEGAVYVGSRDHKVYALKDGKKLW